MEIDYTGNNFYYDKKLNFTPISSVDSFNAPDDYSLGLGGHSSFTRAINPPEADADVQMLNYTSAGIENYNYNDGYGLINAAAAVAEAADKKTFADVPNLGGNNWGADLVKAPEAWAQGYTGKGVVVAVVDTGVDRNHQDLKDNIWTNSKEIAGNGKDDDGNGYVDDVNGWNFDGNNNNTLDVAGHGTHVSGTIAGEKNDFGVTGIAYDAKIMPVKVLDDSGSGSYNAIAQGIRYAADNGANVINLSLGGSYPNSALESALKYASSKGAIVVMAAGNDGGLQPGYPAHYADETGIAVGAVDKNNNLADFSNRAGIQPLTYVTAPGVDVYSTIPNNKYASYSGTSMATPHVAGVVALMLSANPKLTDAQVRQILADTSGNSTQSTTTSLNPSSTTDSNTATSSFISNPINYSAFSNDLTSDFSVPTQSQAFDWFKSDNYGQSNELDFSVSSISDRNTATFSFSDRSTVQNNQMLVPEWSQFQYYQNNLGMNSISYDYIDADSENIFNQPKKQMEDYRHWLVNRNSEIV